MQQINFVFYGVRGSYPVPDQNVAKYGGNTSSILIEKGDKIVVLDAGTGIINIGNYLKEKRLDVKNLDIFLTHFHIDHIQGLPFFEPFFGSEFEINIYCFPYDKMRFKDIILALFNQPYSPISSKGIKAKINFIELNVNKRETISIGSDMFVNYIKEDSHPLAGVLIYRLDIGKKRLVYATDVESPQGFGKEVRGFIRNADVLIHDSQYFDSHYDANGNSKKGFGHSTVSMAVNNAVNAGIKKLFLFHYDPGYSDKEVEEMLKKARKKFKDTFLSEELKKFSL